LSEFKSLGKSGVYSESFESPEDALEPIDIREGKHLHEIQFASDEVAAVCPVTGQPDWYTVSIRFRPNGKSLESKSLKLYLQAFKNTGIFCEMFADRICADITETINPLVLSVIVVQKSRGGITLTAQAGHTSGGFDFPE